MRGANRVCLVVAGALTLLASGCVHRVWLTQSLRENYELGVTDGDVAVAEGTERESDAVPGHTADELQYFIADRIVLQREVSSRDETLAKGRIHVKQGRYVETIVIPRGTPGVATRSGETFVEVSFEEGSAFTFAPSETRGTYQLQTAVDSRGIFSVELEGKRYRVEAGARAQLRVRREDHMHNSWRRRAMRGRRLDTR